jgi:hypothetical protein
MNKLTSVSGSSGEPAFESTTGSAACAQHPQVTHVGAQASSGPPPCSNLVQGSPATTVATPEAVNDNSATMIARPTRRTGKFYQRRSWRHVTWTCLVSLIAEGCAGHGAVNVAPDESKPHISWEIRTGGETGNR